MATELPALRLRAWRNAVFVVFALSGLSVASWASRVPGVRSSLHISTDVVGLILLGMSAGAVIGLAVAPPIEHRLGTRRGMVLALSFNGLGLVLIAVGTASGAIAVVVPGLALLGFGNGAVDVMMNVSAADVERRLGKTIMPLMHGCFSIGTVIGAGIGAGAAALGISVAAHLIAVGAAVVVGVIVCVRYIPDVSPVDPARDAATVEADGVEASAALGFRARLAVWRSLTLVLIGVVMLGMAFAEGSANDWIALASVDGHHRSPAEGAAILDVFVVAMTLGRVAGGPIIDRVGRVAAIRVTAGLGIVGLLLFIVAPAPWAYIVGVGLWGLGASLGFPLGMSAAADDPRGASARVAAVAMIGYCAFLVGPPLIGFLSGAFGLLHALFVVLALLIAAFFCAPALRRRAGSGSGPILGTSPRPGAGAQNSGNSAGPRATSA